MDTAECMTVSDVAKRLKITPQSVRSLIRDNYLAAERIGKQWLVSNKALSDYIQNYDVTIEPDDHPRLSDDLPDIVALSFFSGAMGLDIGMENGGIKALLACEFDKYCRMTIAKNNPDIALIGDINNYTTDQMLSLAKIPQGTKIDVIFGGPPCQAFSTAGARRALDDSRGNVFLRYLDVVDEIKPTYVVIENVRGLLSAPYPYKDIKEKIKGGALLVILDRLEEMGYTVSFDLYNAANFGAPQIRERVVIIGKLNGNKVQYLSPTNSDNQSYNLPPWKTLREAFDTLPDSIEHHHFDFPESRLKYYRMLTEGQYWKHLSPEMQLEAMGNKLKLGGGKTGFFRRISYGKPSPTLVTDPTMPATDLCHPTEDRPLSVEEYGVIQGFPINWKIYGPIKEQYKQIGNAVPIKLGESIARTIIADMHNEVLPVYPGFNFSRYKNTSDITWRKYMDQKLEALRSERDNEQLSLF